MAFQCARGFRSRALAAAANEMEQVRPADPAAVCQKTAAGSGVDLPADAWDVVAAHLARAAARRCPVRTVAVIARDLAALATVSRSARAAAARAMRLLADAVLEEPPDTARHMGLPDTWPIRYLVLRDSHRCASDAFTGLFVSHYEATRRKHAALPPIGGLSARAFATLLCATASSELCRHLAHPALHGARCEAWLLGDKGKNRVERRCGRSVALSCATGRCGQCCRGTNNCSPAQGCRRHHRAV